MKALVLACAALATMNASALELAGVFGDHMVLQRDAALRIWGRAQPGQRVELKLGPRTGSTRVAADGRWQLQLQALPAGGPYEMRVSAGAQRLALKDLMLGDVWIASGQSNMEWPLAETDAAAEDIAASANPLIRHAKVANRLSLAPEADLAPLRWDVSAPATAGGFSAVGYHFARQVQASTGVAVGLLNVSWGGTQIESWMSREALQADTALAPVWPRWPASAQALVDARGAAIMGRVQRWQKAPPLAAGAPQPAWQAPDFNDRGWPTLKAPEPWERQGLEALDGVVWMRRTFTLPAGASPAVLHLGTVDDCDETWINGRFIGKTCGWQLTRRYDVPAGVLREGENQITVRITDQGGDGGFHGAPDALRLDVASHSVPLAGSWRAFVERTELPRELGPNDLPTVIWNGMVNPVVPLPVRGVIWYQGESNALRAPAYAQALPRMIQDWRRHWGQPELPFYLVQLSSFGLREAPDGISPWAELREAQAQTAATVPHAAMAVTIDVGNADDIHPRDKRTVGDRLARIALAQTYGQAIAWRGPRIADAQPTGDGRMRLRFDSAEGLRTRDGGPPRGFAVAGADGRFVPAQAEIRDGTVVVWSPAVPAPKAVRYAWADAPLDANLVNAAGLPAEPGRTDRFPLPPREAAAPFDLGP